MFGPLNHHQEDNDPRFCGNNKDLHQITFCTKHANILKYFKSIDIPEYVFCCYFTKILHVDMHIHFYMCENNTPKYS